MQIGIDRITNDDVRRQLHEMLRSDDIRLRQLKLMGRILRRPPNHPSRLVTYDRFLQPRHLGGPFRAGVRRAKWTEQVISGYDLFPQTVYCWGFSML